jgi:hypothetical protein
MGWPSTNGNSSPTRKSLAVAAEQASIIATVIATPTIQNRFIFLLLLVELRFSFKKNRQVRFSAPGGSHPPAFHFSFILYFHSKSDGLSSEKLSFARTLLHIYLNHIACANPFCSQRQNPTPKSQPRSNIATSLNTIHCEYDENWISC